MAKCYEDSLSRTFGALSDPTRRAVVALLEERDQCSISELAEHVSLTLPGTMKHLDVLARADVVTRTKAGRVVSVHLATPPLREAKDWLAKYDAFWAGSLDKLQRRLERGR